MFVCSKDTLEGSYPALVMAINAARLGMDTKLFFTFMGVNLLCKHGAQRAKYYPSGVLGTIPGVANIASRWLKRKIRKANIPSLEELTEMITLEGGELVACHMTATMMGLDESNFIDGVHIWTAEEQMKFAQQAKVCLYM